MDVLHLMCLKEFAKKIYSISGPATKRFGVRAWPLRKKILFVYIEKNL